MAWQGKITSFRIFNDGWEIGVDYYNDIMPSLTFPRLLKLPVDTTKPAAINAIQSKGAEVRAQVKLTEENFIGQIIPIP